MVYIEVCVGSSCHLKGAPEIVELMQQHIADEQLEDDIILTGAFCAGRCNRTGVTVTVNDAPYTGITKETFRDFWQDTVLRPSGRTGRRDSMAECLTLKNPTARTVISASGTAPSSPSASPATRRTSSATSASCAGTALWFVLRMPKRS